jgi:hypothetical protein
MTGSKIFLGLSVLLWLPYGLYCVLAPEYLAEIAGVVGATATGTTEIRAMYGGLQAGIGALCLTALLNAEFEKTALVTVFFLSAGLFLGRFTGLLLDGSGSEYTYGALVFEGLNTAVAGTFARRALSVPR